MKGKYFKPEAFYSGENRLVSNIILGTNIWMVATCNVKCSTNQHKEFLTGSHLTLYMCISHYILKSFKAFPSGQAVIKNSEMYLQA